MAGIAGQENPSMTLDADIRVPTATAQLARFHIHDPADAIRDISGPHGLAPWRLRRIDERLHVPGNAPTLSALAQLCGLSVRQLTRGFRANCGRSIGEHIAGSRIDQTKQLLAGAQSVTAIAYTLGFCFAFRRATGQPPSEYRHLTST